MRKRFSTALVLAALLAAAPVSQAQADPPEEWWLYGSGWGHGLGLSQWGGYGFALDGWTYDQILDHYYTGAGIGSLDTPPTIVRVGLLQVQSVISLKAQLGKVEIRLGNPKTGTLIGEIPKGYTWQLKAAGAKYEVLNARGEKVGGQQWGGKLTHLYARYAHHGARVYVPDSAHTYNRGFLEFNLYTSGSINVLRMIGVIPPQHYLYGVAEVYSGWPVEMLKAQVVAARTYVFRKIKLSGQHRAGCNCAVYPTTFDQVYHGWEKEGGSYGGQWVGAVNDTAGKVLMYNGALILAVYHASSGGFTENVENVWGGEALPYLRGVCDPAVWSTGDPNGTWSVGPFTPAAMTSKLKPYTGDIGTIESFTAVRGVSGRLVTITAHGTKGDEVVQDSEFKAAFALKDTRVWINTNRNVTGAIRDKYDALGCAPGTPTSPEVGVTGGHRQRFVDGALYHHHARLIVRWLHGPIYDKYKAMGEAGSVLGLPVSGIFPIISVEGARTKFDGGRIYWSAPTAAHALWGEVLTYYLGHGGAGGSLGLPTTDVTELEDGTATASFEGGVVTCPAGGTCSQD